MERNTYDVIGEVERIGQSDSRNPQNGTQSSNLLCDLVHLFTVEKPIFEEVRSVLFDRPTGVEGTDIVQSLHDSV